MKTICSAVALALCATVFGVSPNNPNLNPKDPCCCYLPGEAIPDNCYQPSYNIPARITFCTPCDYWDYDASFDISFIYWYGCQDGMQLASGGALTGADAATGGSFL